LGGKCLSRAKGECCRGLTPDQCLSRAQGECYRWGEIACREPKGVTCTSGGDSRPSPRVSVHRSVHPTRESRTPEDDPSGAQTPVGQVQKSPPTCDAPQTTEVPKCAFDRNSLSSPNRPAVYNLLRQSLRLHTQAVFVSIRHSCYRVEAPLRCVHVFAQSTDTAKLTKRHGDAACVNRLAWQGRPRTAVPPAGEPGPTTRDYAAWRDVPANRQVVQHIAGWRPQLSSGRCSGLPLLWPRMTVDASAFNCPRARVSPTVPVPFDRLSSNKSFLRTGDVIRTHTGRTDGPAGSVPKPTPKITPTPHRPGRCACIHHTRHVYPRGASDLATETTALGSNASAGVPKSV
jgi:hypothetical protein